MVLPTRRLVRSAPAEGDDGAGFPAFVGFVDEPGSPEVASRGSSVMRVRGWVASTRNRPLHVVIRAGRGAPIEVACDRPRPDVVEHLGDRFGAISEACGFQADVALPTAGENSAIPIILDIGDGEFGTTRKYRVSIGGASVPVRSDYKSTWDAAAVDVDSAKLAVSGYTDENEYERTAQANLELLEQTVGLDPSDEILEIGCGVGRVGAALAPRCRRWVGVDVSANMLGHARERLRDFDNVELVEVSGWDLAPIPASSLDVVYCTVVFMHLDEWERFKYVSEAMRVLRPGGRLYIDNFNLCSDPGWAFFTEMATNYHPLGRPPNISKSSTPDEMRTYFERAGFTDVVVGASESNLWLFTHGRKPISG